jgi:hypothetical protein
MGRGAQTQQWDDTGRIEDMDEIEGRLYRRHNGSRQDGQSTEELQEQDT